MVDGPPSTRLAFASLAIAALLASLGTSIANVALPVLTEAFSVSFQAAQWIVLAYLLATTTLIVGAGRLGDIAGRRRLLLSGLALFAMASLFCGAAPSLWLLLVGRAVQGLGAAIMLALTLAYAGEMVPKERTGSAFGFLGTMSAAGTALGPTLGGVLIATVGWRAIFLVNVPPALLALLLAWRALPADHLAPAAAKPRFDVAGLSILALTLAAYALAMTLGRGSFGSLNGVLLVAAVGGMVSFIIVERHAESPLVRLELFRDPALRSGLVVSGLVATVMMASLVVGPFYLDRALGLGAARIGLAMSLGPLVVAFSGVPAGRAVDRLGTTRTVFAGLALMIAGTLLLAVIPATFGVAGYLGPIAVVTLGYSVFQTANNTAVMRDVQSDRRGVISGLLNLSRNLGLITGASVMGAIFAAVAGAAEITQAAPGDIASGMRRTFAVATLLIVFALVMVLRNRPARESDAMTLQPIQAAAR